MQRPTKYALLLLTTALAGCASTVSKLEQVGKAPAHSMVEDPTRRPQYDPISWPLPESKADSRQYANSLWQPGSRAFFRDQRAARVGDILRVNVKIRDKAELLNQTQRQRDSTENLAAPAILGKERKIFKQISKGAVLDNLLDITSGTNTKGVGNSKREEKIETQIAAIVTQVLPNGNFVIEGSQEIRINNDIRELGVKGVVRPQDIGSDNTVDSTQIAEARITYGGRGQLSDMQQPRWGNQVLEVLSPF